MCLIVTKKTKVKIAKTDMVIYKLFKNKIYDNAVFSPYFSGTYTFGALYKTDLSLSGEFSYFDDISHRAYTKYYERELLSYGKGFHGIKTLERLRKVSNIWNKYCFKCIIPKGSEYVEDSTGVIVSNQIIVTNERHYFNYDY